ncbi:MAG: helix-turn-helix transcriptional regulator [Thermoanaerobaculia bacterium]
MRALSREQVEYALGRLLQLIHYRNYTQTQLEAWSGVKQSRISKLMTRVAEPSEPELRKLFEALGLRVGDILNETDRLAPEILLYLASPLTGLSPRADAELRRVVGQVQDVASSTEFSSRPFSIYWPGNFTHPRDNPDLDADLVYLTDRSRASTFDGVIIFCAANSYGVGQENEIITQAGLPAVRLIPKRGLSRMMLGSFIHSHDIQYEGNLDIGVTIDRAALTEGLTQLRRLHFRHRALYRGMNDDSFGPRLTKLINDWSGDYSQFADDLGVSLGYLQRLMHEPFAVTNPSARLLRRMSVLLDVSVGYLLGESVETDPVWVESNASWRRWVELGSDLDAKTAIGLRDDWRRSFGAARKHSEVSQKTYTAAMKEADWDRAYQKVTTKGGPSGKLF